MCENVCEKLDGSWMCGRDMDRRWASACGSLEDDAASLPLSPEEDEWRLAGLSQSEPESCLLL